MTKKNELKMKYRAFNKRAKKFYSKLQATHEDLKSASGLAHRESVGLGIGKQDREREQQLMVEMVTPR